MINRVGAHSLRRCFFRAYKTSSASRINTLRHFNSFLSLRPSAPSTFSFSRIQSRTIMGTTVDRTAEEAKSLLSALQQKFPSKTLGEDRWYILALTTLIAAGQCEHAPTLYTYLISQPKYQTSESRQALMRRLRESLVKSVPIVGVVKPLEAVHQISAVERPEDKDYSFSREHWKSGEENKQRGQAWLDTIYRENRAGAIKSMEAHKDFLWISQNITYGLYLSDHSILDGIDTEIVVLSGIVMQNLGRETGWHLRGTRRVGVSKEDTETIQQCIEMVANFAGIVLDKVPRVADIEHEV